HESNGCHAYFLRNHSCVLLMRSSGSRTPLKHSSAGASTDSAAAETLFIYAMRSATFLACRASKSSVGPSHRFSRCNVLHRGNWTRSTGVLQNRPFSYTALRSAVFPREAHFLGHSTGAMHRLTICRSKSLVGL